METISRSLLTFLVNSLWQIPLAAAVAALVCRFMRQGPARHRHAVWVTALLAALLLPLASVRRAEPSDLPEFPASLAAPASVAAPAPHAPAQAPPAVSPAPASRTISFAETTAAVLLGAWFLFVLFRLARLGWASIRTVGIRRAAQAREIPLRLDRVRSRCQEAFGLSGVGLLFSPKISGPVAAGGTIILPESLLAETSEDVLTTAIGHEMAHIARRDFACNLLYELLLLPVGFHPAAWLIRRGIERTREMACDELVTHRLIDAGVYARSIMSIAAAMTALPRPGYTLGVFDGDILEERIRRLVEQPAERPAANLKRARLLLATGLAALALCAVAASTLAFTARAQGAAGDMMKQGQAAYNRGDYKTAAGEFESAVRLNPDDLEAKLWLAKSLYRQYIPGTPADNPLVTGARQQLLEVMAREPGNTRALLGMMVLTADTRQFAEAHEWAQKAIQADATLTDAYYMAGFLDWSMTYPDYASARMAAGMQPQDPGIIPDTGLRQNVRTQHMAQIEDGLRMLQTALQLDPNRDDAMAYMNLLYRIKAGIVDTPAESAELISQADDWVGKALDAKRKNAQSAQQAGRPSNRYLTASGPFVPAPPPPPPPPPPSPGFAALAAGAPPNSIQVEGSVQQKMLVSQTPPVYPPQAQQAGVTGTVRLGVAIGKDGTVQNIQVISGHPLLVAAAMQAVQKWHLLNDPGKH
jgi:TonB family protein